MHTEQKQQVPVFFHIPKNAGTYCYHKLWSVFVAASQSPYKCNLEVIDSRGNIAYRVIGSKSVPFGSNYRKMNNACWYRIDLESLDLYDFDVFLIEVCDISIGSYKDEIYKKLSKNITPCEFLLLRDPYERVLSLFSYLRSAKSAHESTSGVFGDMTFIEYLNSSYLEGSWLIRGLLKIPNESQVTDTHFKQVCEILDSFLIADVADVDVLISKVLSKCYNLKLSAVKDEKVYAHKTNNKVEQDFASLSEQTKAHFNSQTKWDQLLFNKYTLC